MEEAIMVPSEAFRSVAKLPTTAAKIRALAAKGHRRADIARALGIRYQHVRNVLERDAAKADRENVASFASTALPNKIRVADDGSAVVPAAVTDALGLKSGDVLFVRAEGGEIRLRTPSAVARRVQTMVRKFVPEGVSLVDELIDDRRREVEAES
jgi:bifunctional DNA-binding transcriptional regulator/antitoxin component of YhaV-PrlF toxin-antitoxin module